MKDKGGFRTVYTEYTGELTVVFVQPCLQGSLEKISFVKKILKEKNKEHLVGIL